MKRIERILWMLAALMMLVPTGAMASPCYAHLVLNDDGETYTLRFEGSMTGTLKGATESGEGYYSYDSSGPAWVGRKAINKVVFVKPEGDGEKLEPTTMHGWFSHLSNLTTIEGIGNLSTAKVTDMYGLFLGCSSLTTLDVSGFDTSNVTDMQYMFGGCTNLTSLDLSNFNTAKVTNMQSMFWNCTSLSELDLANFDTQKVTQMQNMFSGCSNLSTLDVSKFNTSKVTDMSQMFFSCSKLESLDLTSFNTQNVENMWSMFRDCSLFTSLDLSGFDTGKVTNMRQMFQGCQNMQTVSFSEKFNTGNVVNLANMFYQCYKLTNIDLSSFNTEKVTDMRYMFYLCQSLGKIDVSSFNTANVTNMSGMFSQCRAATNIVLSSQFTTAKVNDMYGMFIGCQKLTSLDISSFTFADEVNVRQFAESCSALSTLTVGNNSLANSTATNKTSAFTGVGIKNRTPNPCRLVKTFTRVDGSALDKANVKFTSSGQPYYECYGGDFTIADELDCNTDYTSVVNSDADLWVTNRTFSAGIWSTLVLPAGIGNDELKLRFGDDVKVCKIDSYDGKSLKFKAFTGTTTANTPVLVMASQSVANPAFIAVDVQKSVLADDTTEPVDGKTATFHGSYSNQKGTLDASCFYLKGNNVLKRSAGHSTVNTTRGYFTLSDVTATSPAKAIGVDIDNGDGTLTRIGTLTASGELTTASEPAYNLSGQRVDNGYRGIVVTKGRKFVRR